MSRPIVNLALLALLALAAGFASCTKSTSPYGGGGGSPPPAGGPSFNLLFNGLGVSQSFVFADAGSWGYHCAIHGVSMSGTVVVSAGGADSALVSVGVDATNAPALTYTPNTVTIKPGGTVRWVNHASINHTVTR